MGNKQELIVVVDDDITNLTVARNNLAGQYDILTAPSGKKLFLLLEKMTPDLILLDIEMPEMNGYEVIKKLKSAKETVHIPVIFLTAQIDPENEIKGLNLGAVDYITKPFSRELLIKRVSLHLLFEKQKKELMNYSLSLQGVVDKQTLKVFELQNTILQTVAELVERRDSVTGGHIERTQKYLGMLLGFLLEHGIYVEEISTWDINMLVMSSQLHDVGKISIKDDVLMKQGVLSAEEFEEMKRHTVLGVDIIRSIEGSTSENTFLRHAEIFAGSHHEKWDGSGYPYGLKGNEIPLQGRLMAIVDVYDALTNDRPYKEAFTHEEATEIIKTGLGTHFDPLICDVFIMHEKEFKDVTTNKDYVLSSYDKVKSAKAQSVNKILPALKIVSNIMDIVDGVGSSSTERLKKYMEIFISALLKHERYKDEISSWDIDLFLMSVQLHDVGKIAVSNQILKKETKLTESEFESIKMHADYGVKIIQKIKQDVDNGCLLHHAEALAGSHHERWDGTGYPNGLKGYGISLEGRLMAIVDVYDALTSERPYRDLLSHQEAVEVIKSASGTHFDPDLVEIFLGCEKEFESVVAHGH